MTSEKSRQLAVNHLSTILPNELVDMIISIVDDDTKKKRIRMMKFNFGAIHFIKPLIDMVSFVNPTLVKFALHIRKMFGPEKMDVELKHLNRIVMKAMVRKVEVVNEINEKYYFYTYCKKGFNEIENGNFLNNYLRSRIL